MREKSGRSLAVKFDCGDMFLILYRDVCLDYESVLVAEGLDVLFRQTRHGIIFFFRCDVDGIADSVNRNAMEPEPVDEVVAALEAGGRWKAARFMSEFLELEN